MRGVSAGALVPTSTLAMLLLFGGIGLAYFAHKLARFFLPAQEPAPSAAAANGTAAAAVVVQPQPGPSSSSGKAELLETDSEASWSALGRQLTELGLILGYTWVSENAPPNPHGAKSHELDFFWFILVTLFAISLFTVHAEKKDLGILNRDQSEEWRGMMQAVFLLYHVFKLEVRFRYG